MKENKDFGLSSFWLKIIAILCMTLDHTVLIFAKNFDPFTVTCLRSIGRFTFPIMAFLLTEGYVYTKSRFNYVNRLLIFAIISVIPFYMMESTPWNVLFTLCIGLVMLIAKDETAARLDQVDERIWTGLFLLIAGAVSWLVRSADWGFAGVLAIYAAGQVKDKKLRAITIPLIIFAGFAFKILIARPFDLNDVIYCEGILLSAVPLLLYNGELGYRSEGLTKYAFYIYYPVHIFALCMIYYITGNGA